MAGAIYSARVDYLRDSVTKEQADRVWKNA
jgi:hypothetical protein